MDRKRERMNKNLANGGGKGEPGERGSPVSAEAWLRRGELGGGLLFNGSVCCLKNLGRCQVSCFQSNVVFPPYTS